MLQIIVALLAGLLFGGGLLISGMMDRAKVIGFLDITGNWDPSLAFVMGAALLITTPVFYRILKKEKPLLAESFQVPLKKQIDKPLVIGATIFGLGWGLYGFCPGPAMASLISLDLSVFIFVVSMIAGMFLASRVESVLK